MDIPEQPQLEPLPPQAAPPEGAAPPDRYAHLPEDLRVPWDWRDILVFVVFAVGSLMVIGGIVGPIAAAILRLPPALPLRLVFYQTLWSGILMLFLYAMIRIRFQTPFWKTIGFRPLKSERLSVPGIAILYVFGGMMLAVTISLASAINMPKQKLPIQQLFESRETVMLLTFVGIAVAPLLEETIFRGYLYPAIARNIGVTGGVIVIGLLFGLMHAEQLKGGTWQIALISFVGMFFTYVRARSGTVLASYLLHLGYNTILFVGFYASTGGLKNLPGAP